jgi:hypothetical protein
MTERIIDNFLIGFAAAHHDLNRNMNQGFARYRHIHSKFGRSVLEMLKSQYIAHKVFMEGGLLEKLLKHPSLKRFNGKEREYLLEQVKVPWRFSIAVIADDPAKDFFMMKDVFSGEEYLLFSPSITRLKAEGTILLWFNLLGFNGSCWQSYGPIGAYQSFGPDDIFFFATEINPKIEYESEVQKDIETDPLPYMMLISGAAYPRTFHRDHEVIVMMAEHEAEVSDTAGMKKIFISEYNERVYRFTHKTYGEYPHFAQIFFDENEKILLFHALTEYGFEHLIKDYNALGYNIPETAYLRVRLQMVTTAESILKRKIILNEYESLFHKDTDPHVTEETERINIFLSLVIPAINEGREPDIEEAAQKAGLDLETATGVLKAIRQKVKSPKGLGTEKEKEEKPSVKQGKIQKTDQFFDAFRRIYLAVKLIWDLEPWKDLYETDIFGIRMPGSGRIWFISVMGHEGEFIAISAYKGYEGLFGFNQFQENPDRHSGTSLFTIPHLMLSYTDHSLLDKKDLEAINKSGVTFRGKGNWPKFEEVIPGFVPVFPEGETLEDLPELLDQTVSVLLLAMKNPNILYKEGKNGDEILIRTPSGSPGNLIKWNNHYEIPDPARATLKFNIKYYKNAIKAVIKLNIKQLTLQCDLVLLPAPVKEKGKKAYFPFLLLLVDKKNGMVPGVDLLQPYPDLTNMYGSFSQKLLEKILKLGYRPSILEFRSELLFDLAKKALSESGCTPVLVEQMPMMDEAVESMLNSLM